MPHKSFKMYNNNIDNNNNNNNNNNTNLLIYGNYIIESAKGSQQGDPLSGLEFCETVHPTLSQGSSRTKLGSVDDFNLK